jgi:hypothetical protein
MRYFHKIAIKREKEVRKEHKEHQKAKQRR